MERWKPLLIVFKPTIVQWKPSIFNIISFLAANWFFKVPTNRKVGLNIYVLQINWRHEKSHTPITRNCNSLMDIYLMSQISAFHHSCNLATKHGLNMLNKEIILMVLTSLISLAAPLYWWSSYRILLAYFRTDSTRCHTASSRSVGSAST